MNRILVYGYGNIGRKDDGLGVKCALELENWLLDIGLEHVEVETNYQLNIEDAELISNFDTVYFVDASVEAIDDVEITPLLPGNGIIEFSMHAISPALVLHICNTMFGDSPRCYLVHIKGALWDFESGLSERGKVNLAKAFSTLKEELSSVYA